MNLWSSPLLWQLAAQLKDDWLTSLRPSFLICKMETPAATKSCCGHHGSWGTRDAWAASARLAPGGGGTSPRVRAEVEARRRPPPDASLRRAHSLEIPTKSSHLSRYFPLCGHRWALTLPPEVCTDLLPIFSGTKPCEFIYFTLRVHLTNTSWAPHEVQGRYSPDNQANKNNRCFIS